MSEWEKEFEKKFINYIPNGQWEYTASPKQIKNFIISLLAQEREKFIEVLEEMKVSPWESIVDHNSYGAGMNDTDIEWNGKIDQTIKDLK